VARLLAPAMAFVCIGVGFSDAAFSQSECNRECLIGFADRFTKALVEHEPGRAQLAKNAKYTENGQSLKPGDGLWATAGEDSQYRLYATDPAAGQVVLLGVFKESGTPVVAAIRLKVDVRQVTQAEVIVARNDPAVPFRPELLTAPRSVFNEFVDPGERQPRENLLGLLNTYFDGFDENDTGKRIPFDKECQRIENGAEVSGATDPGADPIRRLGCLEQLNTGWSKMVTSVRERRFLVVDDERGLVFAVEFFDYAGVLKTVKLSDGTTLAVPAGMQKPCSLMVANLIKIKAGKVRLVEAVVVPVPYGMKSGWGRQQ